MRKCLCLRHKETGKFKTPLDDDDSAALGDPVQKRVEKERELKVINLLKANLPNAQFDKTFHNCLSGSFLKSRTDEQERESFPGLSTRLAQAEAQETSCQARCPRLVFRRMCPAHIDQRGP
ncbi:MAG: hypothetical protein K2Z81_23055 [Cyanobacteria bacterium]|nr:hypothetical protein [Cyanobacteriota bacterium]